MKIEIIIRDEKIDGTKIDTEKECINIFLKLKNMDNIDSLTVVDEMEDKYNEITR